MKKTLLIFDDHQSIDLWMLQDILKCQHGVIQNVFGFGSLILEAQETVLRIHFVPWVTNKYKRLMSLREQARQRMNYPPGRLKRLSRSSTSVEEINPFPNVASVL